MMPNMRPALRGLTRRVTVRVVKQAVVDRQAVDQGVELRRGSLMLAPMPARKIAIKPEGQRTWKWWESVGSIKLEIGCYITVDKDSSAAGQKRVYEVMEEQDMGQARVYGYQLAETPR